jgi:hypothetical protein
MLGWQDIRMTQERAKDLLREAEQERLVRQVLTRHETMVWEKARELFFRFTRTNSATKKRACATCPSATDIAI